MTQTPNRTEVRELLVLMADCAGDSTCRAHESQSRVDFEADVRRLDANPQWNSANLKFIVVDALIEWNELPESATREFWRRVAERKLPFRRQDPIREVLERGGIKNDAEYELAMDEIGNASGSRFGATELRRLNAMAVAYEKRGTHRKPTRRRLK